MEGCVRSAPPPRRWPSRRRHRARCRAPSPVPSLPRLSMLPMYWSSRAASANAFSFRQMLQEPSSQGQDRPEVDRRADILLPAPLEHERGVEDHQPDREQDRQHHMPAVKISQSVANRGCLAALPRHLLQVTARFRDPEVPGKLQDDLGRPILLISWNATTPATVGTSHITL